MPDGADRREARRFSMSLPMRVLPREARSKALHANTRDVSYRGLYFLSETKFDVGNQIEFVLTGLAIDAKAAWVKAQLEALHDPRPAVVSWSLSRRPEEDAASEAAALIAAAHRLDNLIHHRRIMLVAEAAADPENGMVELFVG